MAQCVPPDICFLCLSRDRMIFCLTENIRHLFGFLTDCCPQTDARVCWECRAMLEKLRRFKEQAKQAVCALERARAGLQPMNFECLSKVYNTQILIIDLLVSDDANVMVTNDCSVDTSKSEICKAYKVEVEFEDENPKIKSKITEEVDLGMDVIYENIPDHIAEDDNDIESKCLTIDLTEDDIDDAIQHDNEQIVLPQTTLKIDPSSSAEEEIISKNLETSSAMKKARGVVKTKLKCKKSGVRKIKRGLTTVEVLINRERRAEEQKYKLFQKGKDLECDHCGKKCSNRHKLNGHMKSHYKNIMCEQCGFKCNAQNILKKHMLAHLDPSHRPAQCDLCHKSFINKYKLLVHTRIHTGERPFKCDNCDKTFVSKDNVKSHIEEKHTDRDTLVKKRISQPMIKSSNWSYIHNHRIRYNNQNYKILRHSENITYECNFCKEVFAQLNSFYEHCYSTHKNRIPCAECNRTFRFLSQLKHHVIIAHRGERPYQCNICGARSKTKLALEAHMSSHSNERRFKCDECLATFKSRSGLWGHKLMHKGVKPHQCDICEARFTLKENLIGHMKVHTKDRHECDICSKKFPLKRNLKNHLKTHLKE